MGSIDAGATLSSSGSWDAFFARLDAPDGTIGARARVGSVGRDQGAAALVNGAEILFIGSFEGTVDFPTASPKSLTSSGGFDVFIARLGRDGEMLDVVGFGGAGDDEIILARKAPNGNLVISGIFDGDGLTFGGSPLSTNGGDDVFVTELTPTLTHVVSLAFGGAEDDRPRDLGFGPGGEMALSGEFRGTMRLGFDTLTASGSEDAGPSVIDAFVAKFSASLAPLWARAFGSPAPDRALGASIDSTGAVLTSVAYGGPVDLGGGVLDPGTDTWNSALLKLAP
jgi:hypothetical protein